MPEPLTFPLSSAGPRAAHEHLPHAPTLAAAGLQPPERIAIGEPERMAIRAAVEQARSLADRDPEHPQTAQVQLPMDYYAEFGFEWHAAGLYRHLWICLGTPGRLPNLPSIRLIAQEFGFDLDHPVERHTWVEELAPGHHAASILEMHMHTPRSAA